jgi:hypothetical protein
MVSKIDNITKIPDLGGTNRISEADISRAVNKYLRDVSSAWQNDKKDFPNTASIIDFFSLVQNSIRSREASEDVPEDKRLLVLADDPPKEIDTEAITFFLKSRTPGQFSRGSAGNARIKEVISHVRSIQQHPEHLGEKLFTMGRFFDNRVGFNIYARDDYTALKRVLWLESVMDNFRWYFRVHGIMQVIEEGVGDKEHVKVGELELTKYPMSYFVRTEDTYQFGSQELKSFEINVEVSTN